MKKYYFMEFSMGSESSAFQLATCIHSDFSLGLFFYPEDGDHMFL
jgi:hypothetical protein